LRRCKAAQSSPSIIPNKQLASHFSFMRIASSGWAVPRKILFTESLRTRHTGSRNTNEIRALRWEDFSGDEIQVRRSAYGSQVFDTKTLTSAAPVPLLPILKTALLAHRRRNPGDGFIFYGGTGKPLVLANLVRRDIKPALNAKGITWRGWHGFRRGLGSTLYGLGVSDKIIQAILRHANVQTTMEFYVKTSSGESQAAMRKLAAAWQPKK
jgi:integrase